MLKRFWWVFLVMAGFGTLVWLAWSKVESEKNATGSISNPETPADRPATRNSDLPGVEHDKEIARESSRHRAGEIERHQAEERRLSHLKKAVKEQEDKVEERRKMLATIVRTKGIIYKGSEADRSDSVETHEESIKKSLDTSDYVDAKRDFETDQKLLQELKLKLITERMQTKQGGR